MTKLLCRGCHEWYDKHLGTCPGCGTPRRSFNPALVSQRWQSALNEKAAQVSREA